MQSFQLIANRFNDEVDFCSVFAPNSAFCSAGLKSRVMSGPERGDYLAG